MQTDGTRLVWCVDWACIYLLVVHTGSIKRLLGVLCMLTASHNPALSLLLYPGRQTLERPFCQVTLCLSLTLCCYSQPSHSACL